MQFHGMFKSLQSTVTHNSVLPSQWLLVSLSFCCFPFLFDSLLVCVCVCECVCVCVCVTLFKAFTMCDYSK